MKVLVTGGTGFVGSHTVAALVEEGHDVRLLVRSPDRVEPALAPYGVAVDNVIAGDVMDEASVRAAVEGCDAMIHGANMFVLDRRRYDQMRRINEDGTDIVLGAAVEAGLDPIVHISSYVVLLPATGTVGADDPVGDPKPAYSKTKALAERVARRYQDGGAPVVTVYPGLIFGPDDPHLGESATMVIHALEGKFGLLPEGTVPICDVRDLAALFSSLMQAGHGPRRVLAVGHDAEFSDLVENLGGLTGNELRVRQIPDAMALFAGRMSDGIARFTGPRPLNYEAPWLVVNGGPSDTAQLAAEIGRPATALDTTVQETVRWLNSAGHISDELAGDLAAQGS